MGKTTGVMKKESKNIKVKNVRKKNKAENIKVQDNLKKKKTRFRRKGKGAIYISHIPHGFYEDEMTAYFSQFGKVVSVKVARSKKTGRSKGYAFVEFLDEEVAKIAADTMNNYMMYNRVLKCSYIPPEKWKGNFLPKISLYNCPRILNRKLDLQRKSKRIGEITDENYKVKAQKKVEGLKKFFEEKGIEFMFKPFNTNNQENETSENNLGVSNVSCNSDSDPDKEFGVLEIDESDKELCFKTPPQVKKIIKKSISKKTINKAKLSKTRRENVNLVKKLKQSSKSKVSKQKSKCKTERKTSALSVS